MPETVTLEVHVLDVTTGHWCPWCGLPSALVLTYVLVDPLSLRITGRGETKVCDDCGQVLPSSVVEE